MRIGKYFEESRKIRLDDNSKKRIKNRVFSSIEELEMMKSFVFADAKALRMPVDRRVYLKESIFERMSSSFSRFVFSKFNFRRIMAFSTSFILVFNLFSNFAGEKYTVFANDFTRIESISGDVFIFRDGLKIKGYEGMELKKKDKITTQESSELSILFLDDSLSRLRENTNFLINELSSFDNSGLRTYVEVEVLSGVVWTKVVNLVGESSSFVVKADDVFAKAKKAAFNVDVRENDFEVSVFKNNIEIHTPFAGEKIANVSRGQRVVVDKAQKILEVKKIDTISNNDSWVASNLENDEKYLEQVNEKITEENTAEIALRKEKLAFADVENERYQFDFAEKDFIEAQLALQNAEIGDEEREVEIVKIKAFKASYLEYLAFIDEVAQRDEKFARDLRNELEESLIKYKKNLNLVLPDSPLYIVKEELKELEYFNLTSEIPLAQKKINDVKDKISDAEEMLNKGNVDIANAIISGTDQKVMETKKLLEEVSGAEKISEELRDTELLISNFKDTIVKQEDGAILLGEGEVLEGNEGVSYEEGVALDDSNEDSGDFDVFKLVEEGKYGIPVMGDKKMDPLFDVLK